MNHFRVSKNHLSTWEKNKERIIQAFHDGHVAKRVNPETFELVNKALLNWFITMRNENFRSSGLISKQKVCNLANEMGIKNFQVPEGW